MTGGHGTAQGVFTRSSILATRPLAKGSFYSRPRGACETGTGPPELSLIRDIQGIVEGYLLTPVHLGPDSGGKFLSREIA